MAWQVVAGIAGALAGVAGAVMGAKEQKRATKAQKSQFEQQQAFAQELLAQAKTDRALAEQLATGQLDFTNAKIKEIWDASTKSIEEKYGKLDELYAGLYGPNGKIRTLVEQDAAAQKAAATAINASLKDSAAKGVTDITQALGEYGQNLSESKNEFLQAAEEQVKGLKTEGTQKIEQAQKDFGAATQTVDQAAIASGNRLSDLQTKGPEGLAAGQAAVERSVSDLAREQERQAAARGVTVSAGEKLATGLARAEALGKTAVQAYDQYGNAINTAAGTQANIGSAQGALAGNRLSQLLSGVQNQASTIMGMQGKAYDVGASSAGLNAATNSANTIQGLQLGAGSTILNNLANYGNKSLIGLETGAGQAQQSMITGKAGEQLGAQTTAAQGQIAANKDYGNQTVAAIDQERMNRAAAQGVSATAANMASNFYGEQAKKAGQEMNESITGFGNSLMGLAQYYGKQNAEMPNNPNAINNAGYTALDLYRRNDGSVG